MKLDRAALHHTTLAVRAERGLAVAFERHHHAPLRGDAAARRFVVQRGEERFGQLVVVAALDSERALPDRRQRDLGLENPGRAMLETEPDEPGAREHDGVALAFVHLAEPGVDVAAHRDDLEIGTRRAKADCPTQAARADLGALGELLETAVLRRDEHITGILSRRDAGDEEAGGKYARHVLDGVHGKIGAALEEGLLDLLHEEALAAHLGERAILDLVASRDDLQLDHLETGMSALETLYEGATLGESELRAPGGIRELHRLTTIRVSPSMRETLLAGLVGEHRETLLAWIVGRHRERAPALAAALDGAGVAFALAGRLGGRGKVEQVVQGAHEVASIARGGRGLQACGRRVQQLVRGALDHLRERSAIALREMLEALPEAAFELGDEHAAGACA